MPGRDLVMELVFQIYRALPWRQEADIYPRGKTPGGTLAHPSM